jgi:hypothetical protein
MLHLFKQAAAIASIVACALSVVLWMRSQTWQDTIYYVPSHKSRVHRADIMVGRVIIKFGGWTKPVFGPGLVVSGKRHNPEHLGGDFMRGFYGLDYEIGAIGVVASLPYWFLTLLTATAAVFLNAKRFRRFDLKRAFFAITLVAVTLGLGMFATKSTTQFLWHIW